MYAVHASMQNTLYSTYMYVLCCVCIVVVCLNNFCFVFCVFGAEWTLLLNSPLTAQDFDSEAFMDKFKDRFLQSVDSHAIVLRLEVDKVISGRLSHSIKNQYVGDGNQELFLYLRRHADLESIRNLCDVMDIDGYPKMSKLGQDMKKYLYLLTSMYVCACHRKHVCKPFYVFVWCICTQVHASTCSGCLTGNMVACTCVCGHACFIIAVTQTIVFCSTFAALQIQTPLLTPWTYWLTPLLTPWTYWLTPLLTPWTYWLTPLLTLWTYRVTSHNHIK